MPPSLFFLPGRSRGRKLRCSVGTAPVVDSSILDRETEDLSQQFGVALFFVSYLLCVGVALMNVVVAVLLEKMVSDEPRSVAETPNETEEKLPEHLEKVCLDIELDCIHLKQQLSAGEKHRFLLPLYSLFGLRARVSPGVLMPCFGVVPGLAFLFAERGQCVKLAHCVQLALQKTFSQILCVGFCSKLVGGLSKKPRCETNQAGDMP